MEEKQYRRAKDLRRKSKVFVIKGWEVITKEVAAMSEDYKGILVRVESNDFLFISPESTSVKHDRWNDVIYTDIRSAYTALEKQIAAAIESSHRSVEREIASMNDLAETYRKVSVLKEKAFAGII